jgi:hypothetical protein
MKNIQKIKKINIYLKYSSLFNFLFFSPSYVDVKGIKITCILIAESYKQNKKDFSLFFLFLLIGMIYVY